MHKAIFCIFTILTSQFLYGQTLSVYGAVGDGLADDTQAMVKAIANYRTGIGFLDGENRTYLIKKRIDISKNVKLKNAKFLFAPDDSYSSKPSNYRAFLLRGSKTVPIEVQLDNITVVRMANKNTGTNSDSAGIWIDYAKNVELHKVEVTGNGRGSGVLIADSENITIRDLYIHNMSWSPCNVDHKTFTKSSLLANKDWNSRYIHNPAHCESPNLIRIEEQISGLTMVRVKNVRVENPIIENLNASFIDGDIAYQTDGITISSNPSDLSLQEGCTSKNKHNNFNITIRGAKISDVWEGIDFTGNPLADILVTTSSVFRSHAFGIKFANGASCSLVKDVFVSDSGLANFVVSGKSSHVHAAPAPHTITFDNAISINAGSNGYWNGVALVAGFRIMNGRIEDPTDIHIINSKSIDTQSNKTMQFGFHSEACDAALSVLNIDSIGHKVAGLSESKTSCR